jgi:acyl carrier protein
MPLPQPVIDFLNESAQTAGAAAPSREDDLFKLGALDSFALVDFLGVLEEHTGIKVPDADVNAVTFQTIEKIEAYVERRGGQGG